MAKTPAKKTDPKPKRVTNAELLKLKKLAKAVATEADRLIAKVFVGQDDSKPARRRISVAAIDAEKRKQRGE